MASDLSMDLYFDPATSLLEIHIPSTGERWIYFLHSYKPNTTSSLSPATSQLVEMFQELSPQISSVQFYVYIDAMTGFLWIYIPYSDEPWRTYILPEPSVDNIFYPSPASTQPYFSELFSPLSDLNTPAPTPIEWSLIFTDHAPTPTCLSSPATPFLGIPTPPQSGNDSPFTIAHSPSNDTPTAQIFTANFNPALPIPRIQVKPQTTPVAPQEGPRNNPNGRAGRRKCAGCRAAKKECVYASEEDVCRRCKGRNIADRCVKEDAPERKRLRRS
jgi:hypothetical protein